MTRPPVSVTAGALGAAAARALVGAVGGAPTPAFTPVVRRELGAHELVNAVNGALTDRGLAVRLHLLAVGLDGDLDAWTEAAAVLGVAEDDEMAAAAQLLADVAAGGDWLVMLPESRADALLIEAGLVKPLRGGDLELTPLGRQRLRDLSGIDIAAEALRRCGGLTAEGSR